MAKLSTLPLVALCLATACMHAQTRPTVPLNPGPQGNGSLLTAASIARGASIDGAFGCSGSMYFRVDNVPEGTVLDITLQTTAIADPDHPEQTGRYCHRGAFPDAHDQYTYTALGGCPDAATPSTATSGPTTEQGPFYIRLWRLEDPSGRCVPGRYNLTVR